MLGLVSVDTYEHHFRRTAANAPYNAARTSKDMIEVELIEVEGCRMRRDLLVGCVVGPTHPGFCPTWGICNAYLGITQALNLKLRG